MELARNGRHGLAQFVDARHEIGSTHDGSDAGGGGDGVHVRRRRRRRHRRGDGGDLGRRLQLLKLGLQLLPADGERADQRLALEHLALLEFAGRLRQLAQVALAPVQLLFQRLPNDPVSEWGRVSQAKENAIRHPRDRERERERERERQKENIAIF